MAFGKIRKLYLGVALLGIVVMLGHNVLVEFGLPENQLGAALTVVIAGSVVTYLYERRLKRAQEIDERVERIRRCAAERAFGAETAALGIVVLVLFFGEWEFPVVPALLALMLGSVVFYELAVEYYRYRM